MVLCLSTSTSEDIQHPTDDLIGSTIADLPSLKEPFAILGVASDTYIQTYWSQDGYELEFQEGTVERHYRVTRWLSREETVDAFLRFARGDRSWITEADFERLDPKTWKPCDEMIVRRTSPLLVVAVFYLFAPVRGVFCLLRLWTTCKREKDWDEGCIIRLPNEAAGGNYVASLNCERCGGSLRPRRGHGSTRPDGWIQHEWTLTCRQCRKSERTIIAVPGPNANPLFRAQGPAGRYVGAVR